MLKERKKECLRKYKKHLDDEEARIKNDFDNSSNLYIEINFIERHSKLPTKLLENFLEKEDIDLFYWRDSILDKLAADYSELYSKLLCLEYVIDPPSLDSDFLSSKPLGNFNSRDDPDGYVHLRDDPRSLFIFNLREKDDHGLSEDKDEVQQERMKHGDQVPSSEVAEVSNALKLRGNRFFKARDYDSAYGCYSKAIEYSYGYGAYDATAIYFQNRAAVSEATENFIMVEIDCTEALNINPTYIKALQRRSRAYLSSNSLFEALDDAVAAEILLKSSSDEKVESTTHELSLRLGRKAGSGLLVDWERYV